MANSPAVSSPARIVCIPSADAAFAADVNAVADRIPGALPPSQALSWFADELSRAMPNVVVREQEAIARAKGEPPVWYVSRRRHHFRIDTGVSVPLPAAAAYRLYTERVVEWQTAVKLTLRRAGQPLVGAEYDATYSFVGRQYTGQLRILAADPWRSVSIEASGSGITVWYVTSFRPERDGTSVRVKGDYELPDTLVARIADRLGIERAIGRDIDRANESYRALCVRAAAQAASDDDPDDLDPDDAPPNERG